MSELVQIVIVIDKERAETFMGLLVGEGTSFTVTQFEGDDVHKRKSPKTPNPRKGKGKHGGKPLRDIILAKISECYPKPASDIDLMNAAVGVNCSPMSVSSQTSALAKEKLIQRLEEGKWVLCKK